MATRGPHAAATIFVDAGVCEMSAGYLDPAPIRVSSTGVETIQAGLGECLPECFPSRVSMGV